MKNKYKIDVNSYVSGRWPVAIYVKRPWRWYWEHMESFETIEDAQKKFSAIMERLPIFLSVAS